MVFKPPQLQLQLQEKLKNSIRKMVVQVLRLFGVILTIL
jgi:hypothetical protein